MIKRYKRGQSVLRNRIGELLEKASVSEELEKKLLVTEEERRKIKEEIDSLRILLAERQIYSDTNVKALEEKLLLLEKKNDKIEKEKFTQTELFTNNLIAYSRLANEMYDNNHTVKSLSKVVGEVISSWRDPGKIEQLEISFNIIMNNFFKRLREQCKSLNEKDLQIAVLLVAGCSPKAVCYYLDMNPKTLYSRRERLIKKINNSEAQDKDEFIKAIKKKYISN